MKHGAAADQIPSAALTPVPLRSALVLEEATFARRDRLPLEIEVLRLEELLRAPFSAKTTTPTRTRFHSLLLVEEGSSWHHVDFAPRGIGPRDLLVIPEGSVQAFDRAGALHGCIALFTADFLARCGLATRSLAEPGQILLRSTVQVTLSHEALTRVRQAFDTLANHTRSVPAERFTTEAIAAAFSLLIFTVAGLEDIAAAVVANRPRDELVARFLDLLEDRFATAHQASSYARALHVSLRTLDRQVQAHLGQTARQAIAARLVLEAKRLLAGQDMPVKNIAYALGFSEPQNFTRFFSTQTGCSPELFRSSLDQDRMPMLRSFGATDS